MNELANLTAVKVALLKFNNCITSLSNTIAELETNKGEISSAWNSSNATIFVGQYTELISYLQEAYDSLTKYQQKISNVVKEFEGFDNSIQYEKA